MISMYLHATNPCGRRLYCPDHETKRAQTVPAADQSGVFDSRCFGSVRPLSSMRRETGGRGLDPADGLHASDPYNSSLHQLLVSTPCLGSFD